MSSAYTDHSDVCARFYQLTVDSCSASRFILERSSPKKGQKALFVGSMFDIAQALVDHGLVLSIVDYSDEMVQLAQKRFPDLEVARADLKNLPFKNKFDIIYVVGRVFTHMITNADLVSAIQGCRRALVPGGYLFFDNYEDSKIMVTNYFNGEVVGESSGDIIKRTSSTELISKTPYIVLWKARYQGRYQGVPFDFSDTMEHRAWSRKEIGTFLGKAHFEIVDQGDNFDDTSFYTFVKTLR